MKRVNQRPGRAVLWLFVLAGCSPGESVSIQGPLPTNLPAGTLMDCPNHDSVLVSNGTFSAGVDTFSVSGAITLIPEYHDCQRFVMNDGKFGPLVAIFAASRDAQEAPPPPRTSADSAVAQIVSGGDYGDLGIIGGHNCLYMWKATNWSAVMVQVGRVDACDTRIDTGGRTAIGLFVREIPPPDGVTGPWPRGARWDMDTVNARQYISIACGGQWCEVHKDRTGVSSGTYTNAPSNAHRAVFGIKGWYDEQRLTLPDPLGSGNEIPTVRGSVFPEPGLRDITSLDAFNAHWIPTARVHIVAPSPEYKNHFGLEAGGIPNPMNEVSACRGRWADCDATGAPDPCPAATPVGVTEMLFARVESANTRQISYHCLYYRKHGVHGPRETARWRWPSLKMPAASNSTTPGGLGLPFGMGMIVRPAAPLMLLNGGGIGGIWHWCPEGCCTM